MIIIYSFLPSSFFLNLLLGHSEAGASAPGAAAAAAAAAAAIIIFILIHHVPVLAALLPEQSHRDVGCDLEICQCPDPAAPGALVLPVVVEPL